MRIGDGGLRIEGGKPDQYEHRQEKAEGHPALNELAAAPEPLAGFGYWNGSCAIKFEPENPTGVQADGEIQVAGPMIRQAKDDAGQQEGEKAGDKRVRVNKSLAHEGQ